MSKKLFIPLAVVVSLLVVMSISSYASGLPEWDGVYVKYQDGAYEELKEVAAVRVNSSPSGVLYYNTKDFTIIAPAKFKGIFVKGKEFVKSVTFIHIDRNKEMSLAGFLVILKLSLRTPLA